MVKSLRIDKPTLILAYFGHWSAPSLLGDTSM
jgi:hypothetical protein